MSEKQKAQPFVIFASLLANSVLMGVVSALLRFVGFEPDSAAWLANPASEILSIVAYVALIAYVILGSMRARKS